MHGIYYWRGNYGRQELRFLNFALPSQFYWWPDWPDEQFRSLCFWLGMEGE